ncbi:MAG: ATP-binding cassette domain-containing protein [Acidimicrobiales bacterium]
MTIPKGVIAGFVGPNGAGKTTTMRMLVGLVTPDAGTATVLGQPRTEPHRYLHRVGALIESPAFYPSLTGRQNLRLLARLGRVPSSRVDEAIELVGLASRGDDAYRTYSLGMKQRLGIAAAVLPEPGPAQVLHDHPAAPRRPLEPRVRLLHPAARHDPPRPAGPSQAGQESPGHHRRHAGATAPARAGLRRDGRRRRARR